tara:strand:- start:3519 stop:3761 length:243 start_codon:yes stop_codon:yes gene_type:complete
MDTNLIKEMIKKTISNAKVEVYDTTGTSDHFKVVVLSDIFEGMSLINRHKLIYKSLDQYITKEIHALQIIAQTNNESTNE